ncbi:MAG: GNAT family N-acetyltransferase, partial [Chitinophagales bacterium]
MKNKYIFKSKRLGFRTWKGSDLEEMTLINSSKEVMKYFPNTQTKEHTKQFIAKMNKSFEQNSYCYFAVDILKT